LTRQNIIPDVDLLVLTPETSGSCRMGPLELGCLLVICVCSGDAVAKVVQRAQTPRSCLAGCI
jgi:hypothetical protein